MSSKQVGKKEVGCATFQHYPHFVEQRLTMGWEKRGNGLYYYTKRREGRRVVSEYVGRGDLAEAIATLDALDREERELEQEAWRLEREAILSIARAGTEAQEVILTLTRAWLLAQGYHTHKGQWRRRRKRGRGND